MEKNRIEVKSVKLQLGRKEVELTIDEAKKLKAALDDMFTSKVVREFYHGWYYYPTYTYTKENPQITYTTSDNTSCSVAISCQ